MVSRQVQVFSDEYVRSCFGTQYLFGVLSQPLFGLLLFGWIIVQVFKK